MEKKKTRCDKTSFSFKPMNQIVNIFTKRIWIHQAMKFLVVGGLGTITNLVLFYFLVDKYQCPYLLSSTVCFILAVSQNYLLNQKWTFKKPGMDKIKTTRYLKFLIFSSLALTINLFTLETLVSLYSFPYMVVPQACGILAATGFNFILSKFVTFNTPSSMN